MNNHPKEQDLAHFNNKEHITLLKHAFIEFSSKPYSNLLVADLPHLRPLVLRLREKELLQITLDLLKEDEQMQQWAFAYLFQKYVARLERDLKQSTLKDECFHYKCILAPRDLPIDFHLTFFFTKYAYYQTHINEPEHKDFWMLSLMTYSKFVEKYDDTKLSHLEPMEFIITHEEQQKEYTAIIIKQFIDFVEASSAETPQ